MPAVLNISIQNRTTRSLRQNCWATTLRSNPMSKERMSASRIVNCHIKCDWQWFWPNYVRLSFPQYLRLGEKIQETGLLVSLTGWLCSASGRGCLRN